MGSPGGCEGKKNHIECLLIELYSKRDLASLDQVFIPLVTANECPELGVLESA